MSRQWKLEVGKVYTNNNNVFLAVDEDKLVTWNGQDFRERTPYKAYDKVPTISVKELCRTWGISEDTLDRVSERYFTPPNNRRTRQTSRSRARRASKRPFHRLRLGS